MLLTLQNAKAIKSQEHGFLQANLELAPGKTSGRQVCPFIDGCAKCCIFNAGRGRFDNVQTARIGRTRMLFYDRHAFLMRLTGDIFTTLDRANAAGFDLAVRLNTFSDLAWWKIKTKHGETIFDMTPKKGLMFFDYTKRPVDSLPAGLPDNYHITWSAGASTTPDQISQAMDKGYNVAVPFIGRDLPDTYQGHTVIDGDEHDLRFLDPHPVIVGLRAKGDRKTQRAGIKSGFIRPPV